MNPPDPDSRDDIRGRLAALEALVGRQDGESRDAGPNDGGRNDGSPNDAGLKTGLSRLLRLLPLVAAANAVLAVPALVISVGVAYFAFVQAEATDKMQVASVWPRVTYATSNQDGDGTERITLSLVNKGVGPALIRGMEIRYRGKAYTGFRQLIDACCARPDDRLSLGIGSINGEVLRPGEEMMFALMEPDGTPPAAYRRFATERGELAVRICYCSVFDDCWVDDWRRAEPVPVAQCPADWVQYSGFPQGQVFPKGESARR